MIEASGKWAGQSKEFREKEEKSSSGRYVKQIK